MVASINGSDLSLHSGSALELGKEVLLPAHSRHERVPRETRLMAWATVQTNKIHATRTDMPAIKVAAGWLQRFYV